MLIQERVRSDEAVERPPMILTAHRHDTLQSVEALWREFETHGVATVFQRLDWVRAMERHLVGPARGTLFVIELRDAASSRPLMLMPFVLLKKPGYRVVEYLGLGVCDYSAPLVAPGVTIDPRDGDAVWAAIRGALPAADLFRIGQICQSIGVCANPLATLPGIRKAPMQSFDVAITGDAARLVERIANGQTRRILKTATRRIKERGELRFVHAATTEEMDVVLTEMIAQRRRRFRELGRFDLLASPAVQAFYADIARLGHGGPVRLFGLGVGADWVATAFCLAHRDALILTIPTMAGDEWKACSPGMTLMAHFIRWAREDGRTVMDFSVGEMAYKTGFGGSPRDLFELSIPLTARGRGVAGIQHAFARTKARIRSNKRLFERLRRSMQFYRWLKNGPSARRTAEHNKDRGEGTTG